MISLLLLLPTLALAVCERTLSDRLYDRLVAIGAQVIDGKMIKTQNGYGTSIVGVDPYVAKYLAHVPSAKSILEIGAGHGIAAARAIDAGATSLVLNDANVDHFAALKSVMSPEQASRVTWVEGIFPDRFADYPEESFDLILLARVIHFAQPDQYPGTLNAISRLLAPGGSVVATALSPENSHFAGFLHTYRERQKAGDAWPGRDVDTQKYRPGSNLPPYLHLPDPVVWRREFTKAGFEIEEVGYIDRRGQYPEGVLLGGKEGVGIIARKPKLQFTSSAYQELPEMVRDDAVHYFWRTNDERFLLLLTPAQLRKLRPDAVIETDFGERLMVGKSSKISDFLATNPAADAISSHGPWWGLEVDKSTYFRLLDSDRKRKKP